MPPIRTLLWIGPGETLARLQVTDTPTLDVVWLDGAEALQGLPPIAVDAIVIASFELALALQSLALLRASRVQAPALVLLDRVRVEDRARLLAAGADALCAFARETHNGAAETSALGCSGGTPWPDRVDGRKQHIAEIVLKRALGSLRP